jgi:hypothetical protein
MDTKFMGEFDTLKSIINQLMNPFQGPSSSEQPSHLNGVDSSHSMVFQSNSFHRDPRLEPRVEVNKFDGLDSMGWVTQMEHYFSLHGITDELAKLRYTILYLDLECWQWWKWHKNACQGYVPWIEIVAELYECFDTNTHYLGRMIKLKQSGIVEDFITAFEQ